MGGPLQCPHCGAPNPEGSRFCNGCGASLMPGEVPPTTGPDPATQTALSGDRRLVTVLFADISGFTSLSEELDPEAVRDLTSACFDRVVPCIERYGGTIDKFIDPEGHRHILDGIRGVRRSPHP